MKTYLLEFPEDLASFLLLSDEDFSHEVKKMALVKLFELGKISSGKAAKALGMHRVDFLFMLHDYQVSIFNDSDVHTIVNDKDNA